MEIFRAPRVTLLARPEFLEPEHLRVEWRGEASPGERLAEYAGRLCYMSQHNPVQRTTVEYLENIKKQGHGSPPQAGARGGAQRVAERDRGEDRRLRKRAGVAHDARAARLRRRGARDPGDGDCVSPRAAARGAGAVLRLRGLRRRRSPRRRARRIPQGLTSEKNPISLLRIAPPFLIL